MPELPEVETIVNDLRPQLVGRRFESLQLTRDPAIRARLVRYPSADKFIRRLRGRTIKAVERRGKDILVALDSAARGEKRRANGDARTTDQPGVVHLGITGHPRGSGTEKGPGQH